MRIAVVGAGYLGSVHAACMAHQGHDVVAIDLDEAKIRSLADGEAPFFEPGLDELLAQALDTGRLRFTTEYRDAAEAQVHFICVGTPQRAGEYAADTSYVLSAGRSLAPHVAAGALVVGKSTVPVGTAIQLRRILTSESGAEVRLAWNPEFLREGLAIKDTLEPGRLVYGISSPAATGDVELLDVVYAPQLAVGTPRIILDYATAELVKVSANAFLATKISFINAIADVCEAAGADVVALADAIGLDPRIGRDYLNAGLGFGGGCLPKDIRGFMARAGELGADQVLTFLREVDAINMRRRERMLDLAREECGGTLIGKRIAVLGAAFKPNSDDIRDSPALDVAMAAKKLGATITVHDPKAIAHAKARAPELSYSCGVEVACWQADVVLLLTEWQEYRDLDPAELIGTVRFPCVVDGRNALDPNRWRAAGWKYRALGRPKVLDL
ncbi:MAG: UDP-glucose/GDP-mannose dehydrogenase family protein [Dermatophilaceae bacterium]